MESPRDAFSWTNDEYAVIKASASAQCLPRRFTIQYAVAQTYSVDHGRVMRVEYP